jgi:ankyrin repeat protein
MLTYHPPPPPTSPRCSSSFGKVPTKTPGKFIFISIWAIRLMMSCFVYSGLLKKPGLSVDVRDKFGNTPLIVACQNGHGRLAKMCVRYGADVNAVNHKKNTPLHFTVQYGFNALGDFLVDKGANRDARNDEGKTPYEGL